MNRYFAAAVILFAAQDPSSDFTVVHIGDERLTGSLVKLENDLQLNDGKLIPSESLVALRRSAPPPPQPHGQPHILLANGDIIPGKLKSILNDQVHFAVSFGADVDMTLPLTAVSSMSLSHRSVASPDPKPRADIVRLTNGDSIIGTVVSVNDGVALRIDSGGQVSEVPRDRIESITFNSELTRAPKPPNRFWRAVLKNGARLSLNSVVADASVMKGKTTFGSTVEFPLAEVVTLTHFGGTAKYLSDMKPLRYEHAPFLGVRWPLSNDRNVVGKELRLSGGWIDKGIGLHSACSVTYKLPPDAKRFETLAGLDEETGRLGAALLDVRANGRSLLSKPISLKGNGRAHELRLPLPAGSKELTITVDYGPGGDVQDHVDLANALIISAPR